MIPAAKGNYQVGRKDVRVKNATTSSIDMIVLHTMDGSYKGSISWFTNPASKASAHYLISLAGECEQMVALTDTAYHATNYSANLRSIGIEHEDQGNPNHPRSQALYERSARLVADLSKQYNIPLDTNHIKLHREIYSGKSCPGNLDRNRIIARAKELLSPTTPPQPKPQEVATQGGKKTVTITEPKGANVRTTPETNTRNITRTLPLSTRVEVDGFVTGQSIANNPLWYKVSGRNEFLWAGTTSDPRPTVTPTPSPAKPVDPLEEMSKEALIAKVKTLDTDIRNLTQQNQDQGKKIEILSQQVADKSEEVRVRESQAVNYANIQEINRKLQEEVIAYRQKNEELRQEARNAVAQAFTGWELYEIPKDGTILSSVPPIVAQIANLLSDARAVGYVVGWKKGGRLVKVEG